MSRAMDRARKAIEKADADVRSWEARLSDVRVKRAALDASAASRLLDDPSALDDLTAETQRLDAHARQISSTVAEAQHRSHEARRALLLITAEEESKVAVELKREADHVRTQVANARATLEELDGTGWIRFERQPGVAYSGDTPSWNTPREAVIEEQADLHRAKEAIARRIHGRGGPLPNFFHELEVPSLQGLKGHRQITPEMIPDTVREFLGMPLLGTEQSPDARG